MRLFRYIRGFRVRNDFTSCSRSDSLISVAGLAERGASMSRMMAGCADLGVIWRSLCFFFRNPYDPPFERARDARLRVPLYSRTGCQARETVLVALSQKCFY
jgi:hypothetical protein